MGLNRYEVTVDGRHPHTTTLLLSDEDAKRMGVFKQEKAKAAPQNKARTASNKAAAPRRRKPAAKKPAARKPAAKPGTTGVEDATDPSASV